MSDNRYDLMIAASLLDQGRIIDGLSRLLTAIALLGLILLSFAVGRLMLISLAIAVLAGCIQVYLAIRVGFDAALFRTLAAQNHTANLEAFDTAMQRQGLMPAEKAGRPVPERIAGARRLFGRQGAFLIVQIAALLAGIIVSTMT